MERGTRERGARSVQVVATNETLRASSGYVAEKEEDVGCLVLEENFRPLNAVRGLTNT